MKDENFIEGGIIGNKFFFSRSWNRTRCSKCSKEESLNNILREIFPQKVMMCEKCIKRKLKDF